ncbi:hypothetical protein COBT_000446 [Conglomerata obtusa]
MLLKYNILQILNQANEHIRTQIISQTESLMQYAKGQRDLRLLEDNTKKCKTLYNYFDKVVFCEVPLDDKYIEEIRKMERDSGEHVFTQASQFRIIDMWRTSVRKIMNVVVYDKRLFMSGEIDVNSKVNDYSIREVGIDDFFEYLKNKITVKFLTN